MYTIDRTNPSNIPITVDMSTTKTQAGLTWVGQYHSRYGEILHENSLKLLENFASDKPPEYNDDTGLTFNKLNGMLWYDTDEDHTGIGNLKIQNGRLPANNDGWKRLEVIISASAPTKHTHGEIFFDTTDLTLAISRGNRWDNVTVKKAIDSDLLDGLDSTQFLRRDVPDSLLATVNTSTFLPRSNRTYDLGSGQYMYRNMYTSTLMAENTHSLTPSTDDVYSLGTGGRRFKEVNSVLTKSQSFTDVSPLGDNSYKLGSESRRWSQLRVVTVHATDFNNVIPMNNSVSIGTSGSRWSSVFANELDAVSTKSLIPTNNNTYSLGSSTRRFTSLDVGIVKNTKTETLTPNTNNAFNLGSPAYAYNSIFINNIYGEMKPHGDFVFDIVVGNKSKGITWEGLSDSHKIYVEEVTGTETTRLVLHSGDNMDTDGLIIRQSSAVTTKDVIDVKYSNVTINAGNLKNVGTLEVQSQQGTGCRQVFHHATGTLMFVFY